MSEPVDPLVYSSAQLLARRVWRDGPISRVVLTPVGAAPLSVEEPLAVGVERGWLRIDGDVVTRGSVNPSPWERVG